MFPLVTQETTLNSIFALLNPIRNMIMVLVALYLLVHSGFAQAIDIQVLYLKQIIDKPPALSNILPQAKDSGVRGAELGISDNNSAGRFLKQNYQMTVYESRQVDDLIARARDWLQQGQHLMVMNVPTETLVQLAADPAIAGNAILFNASAANNSLRQTECRSGLLHTAPSHAMLTDALMQFLIKKRWRNWLLIKGVRDEDQYYAQSLKRSSKRFGGKLVAEKTWTFDTDLRRSAVNEVPGFTQVKEHDVIAIADEAGDFGEYIPFNSFLPRPVVGTQGLTPVAWHRVVEQWGAAQLQNRFEKLAGRWMNSLDYSSWLAVRSIAEAITRTASTDYRVIYAYLLGPDFALAGFKGRKLSFRDWNGQMRQPIPLVHPRALVANSPIEGFLHPRSELDTLGYDQPEVNCVFQNTL